MKIIPTILCGGSGTRLWPLSRTHAPKQLQALTNEKSLLANTVLRLQASPNCIEPVLICGRSYVDLIEAQMSREDAQLSAVITEPSGRDTAAAAAIAAHWGQYLQEQNSDEDYVVLLLPADHHISNIDGFHNAINAASRAALNGFISTIGITPNAPETGFGYINRAAAPLSGLESYPVVQFVEKPDETTAQAYLESGDFLWNAGMFAFRPAAFLSELAEHAPEIAQKAHIAFNAASRVKRENAPVRIDLETATFMAVPSLSVDYAVMEKTTKASVLPAEFGWNDVGSWAAAHEIADTDDAGNALVGDVLAIDTKNSLVKSYDKLIAVVDVEDMVVIDTQNAILICPRESSQKVKAVHKKLLGLNHPSALHHGKGTEAHKKLIETAARKWLFDTALPFWMDHGEDRHFGGVYEAVDFSGRVLQDLPKRLRVQARQTYLYAQAHIVGAAGAIEAMQAPLNFMLDKFQTAPGRFAHLLSPKGEVIDGRADSYDHAFVLFALAWAYKATGDRKLLTIAESTMDFVQSELCAPGPGLVEAIPATNALRRANPHMHMFEAAQAWMSLHNHGRMAEIAREMFDLFHSHFCIGGLLREFFEDDLSPLKMDASAIEQAVEPGHLYEWAYLLRNYKALTGSGSASPAVMEAFADRYGINPANGLVLDHVFADGEKVPSPTSRLWPQTEYIRLKFMHQTPESDEAALLMLERLMAEYFTFEGEMPGYWRDQLDENGNNILNRAPASSFYHIMGCLLPLIK